MQVRLGKLALAVFGALLGLGGCFFEPRVPETGGGPVCFESIPRQDSESAVFANLDGALRCLQTQTYLDQLSEEFVFVPSPVVAALNPALFPDPETSWTFEREEAFVDRLFADAGSITATIYTEVNPPSGTTERLYEGSYFVSVTTGGSTIEYTGEALFTLRQERTTWFIVRWEEKESNSPLGQLRASLLTLGG